MLLRNAKTYRFKSLLHLFLFRNRVNRTHPKYVYVILTYFSYSQMHLLGTVTFFSFWIIITMSALKSNETPPSRQTTQHIFKRALTEQNRCQPPITLLKATINGFCLKRVSTTEGEIKLLSLICLFM